MNARRIASLLAITLATAGCATTGAPPSDPWEGMNRAVFSFNEAVDRAVLKPVATGYEKVVPEFARNAIDNVFGNIGDAWSAINHLLQAKPQQALEMGLRFSVNTVFGFGGVIDIASEAGLERRTEDFGQTLGRWGLGSGPYVVLPLLGPSTLRDTAALTLDLQAQPAAFFDEPRDRYGIATLQIINTRAKLLSTTRTLDDIALDKYSLVRDGFLARRRNQVYDGNPPEEPETPDNEGTEATERK
jgi:phospholipid-binding lipoprotein MlaA